MIEGAERVRLGKDKRIRFAVVFAGKTADGISVLLCRIIDGNRIDAGLQSAGSADKTMCALRTGGRYVVQCNVILMTAQQEKGAGSQEHCMEQDDEKQSFSIHDRRPFTEFLFLKVQV